jgi:hypothetical protein
VRVVGGVRSVGRPAVPSRCFVFGHVGGVNLHGNGADPGGRLPTLTFLPPMASSLEDLLVQPDKLGVRGGVDVLDVPDQRAA